MLDATFRQLRLIHFMFLAASAYLVGVTEVVLIQHAEPIDQPGLIAGALGVVAFGEIGFGLVMRSKVLEPAGDTLRTRPDDAAALARWRSTQMLSFVIAESIVMLGMVVRLLSGERLWAMPFWAGGFALLLMWMPRRPE